MASESICVYVCGYLWRYTFEYRVRMNTNDAQAKGPDMYITEIRELERNLTLNGVNVKYNIRY